VPQRRRAGSMRRYNVKEKRFNTEEEELAQQDLDAIARVEYAKHFALAEAKEQARLLAENEAWYAEELKAAPVSNVVYLVERHENENGISSGLTSFARFEKAYAYMRSISDCVNGKQVFHGVRSNGCDVTICKLSVVV
jgi:hypothetical protein